MSRQSLPKRTVRAAARLLLGDYTLYAVVARVGAPASPALPAGWSLQPIDATALSVINAHPDPIVRRAAGFEKRGADGFALWEGDQLLAALHFHDHRICIADDWPVADGEAMLVNVVTLPEQRGRGAAPLLIAAATHALGYRGIRRFLATVWWTNRASLRAFSKAGWRVVGLSATARPLRQALRLRLPFRRG